MRWPWGFIERHLDLYVLTFQNTVLVRRTSDNLSCFDTAAVTSLINSLNKFKLAVYKTKINRLNYFLLRRTYIDE